MILFLFENVRKIPRDKLHVPKHQAAWQETPPTPSSPGDTHRAQVASPILPHAMLVTQRTTCSLCCEANTVSQSTCSLYGLSLIYLHCLPSVHSFIIQEIIRTNGMHAEHSIISWRRVL